jgi:hypothetical protein
MLKSGGILVATLPWKENLDNNMAICPKCHHKFHRIGHFHSFDSYNDVVQILGSNFQILTFDFILSKELEGIVIELFKKTVFRRKYYKDGFPSFLTTCFFVARLDK